MVLVDYEDEYKSVLLALGLIVVVLSGVATPVIEFIFTLLSSSGFVNLSTLSSFFQCLLYKSLVMILLWLLLVLIVASVLKFDRRGEEREWHLKLFAGAMGLAFGPILAMNILIPILEQIATQMFLTHYSVSDYSIFTNQGTFFGLLYQNILVAPKFVMLLGFPLFMGLASCMITDIYEVNYIKGIFISIPIAFLAFVLSGPIIDLALSFVLGVI
ncbi:MAG: hypothetical protein ACXQS8_07735 [Candidatus Helarchaeales archaeon]